MEQSRSKIIGSIILIVGIVFTIFSLSTKNDFNTKVVLTIIGMVVSFLGRAIAFYEWLD